MSDAEETQPALLHQYRLVASDEQSLTLQHFLEQMDHGFRRHVSRVFSPGDRAAITAYTFSELGDAELSQLPPVPQLIAELLSLSVVAANWSSRSRHRHQLS